MAYSALRISLTAQQTLFPVFLILSGSLEDGNSVAYLCKEVKWNKAFYFLEDLTYKSKRCNITFLPFRLCTLNVNEQD